MWAARRLPAAHLRGAQGEADESDLAAVAKQLSVEIAELHDLVSHVQNQEQYRQIVPPLREAVFRVESAWLKHSKIAAASSDSAAKAHQKEVLRPESELFVARESRVAEMEAQCLEQKLLILQLQKRCRHLPRVPAASITMIGGLQHAAVAHTIAFWRQQADLAKQRAVRELKAQQRFSYAAAKRPKARFFSSWNEQTRARARFFSKSLRSIFRASNKRLLRNAHGSWQWCTGEIRIELVLSSVGAQV